MLFCQSMKILENVFCNKIASLIKIFDVLFTVIIT